VADDKQDIKFYRLDKFVALARDNNPNIIELLFLPPDLIRNCAEPMQRLIDNRHLFLSKKAKHSFAGYAHAQIERAKGQNKWVNNSQSESPPDKLNFCWFIDPLMADDAIQEEYEKGNFPYRPVPLLDTGINLAEFHAAKLEHCADIYRLYYYGKGAKGVFRGPHQQFEVESISKEDEWLRFRGLLIWNRQAYESAMRNWQNYWTWHRERNKDRWRTQESGEMDYDCKNLCHCVRLMLSGINILRAGEPIIRFEGEAQQFLRDIRAGKFTYDYLIEYAEAREKELDSLYETSTLRHEPDDEKINKLYLELIGLKA
jgi:predicted nucleotidyltransferase